MVLKKQNETKFKNKQIISLPSKQFQKPCESIILKLSYKPVSFGCFSPESSPSESLGSAPRFLCILFDDLFFSKWKHSVGFRVSVSFLLPHPRHALPSRTSQGCSLHLGAMHGGLPRLDGAPDA